MRRDELESLRTHPIRMPKPSHVTRREEVERLHLFAVPPPLVQRGERLQERRTGDRDAANGWKALKPILARWQS
jgi:hypothetical protein